MFRILILLSCLGTIVSARAAASDYCWPLDLDTRYLTANFMESRDGRFHTGIDLKTEERTGISVRAVCDGWISRIKFAPEGYGKAVYLAGDDGRTYVYGHLARLADPLRDRVRRRQTARGAYRCDVHLPAGQLPVRRGEVIALSGRTATNGPHLHFEVRDASGQPVDPLRHGFAVADTIAPEILAVRVWWGNRSYRYGDGATPLTGDLPALVLPPGPVRVSSRVVERSDHLRYRLAPHHVALVRTPGDTLFGSANDRVRWTDVRRERVVFRETSLGRERLFWRPGTTDGVFVPEGGGGPPAATFVLTATDAAGNRSRVRWTVAFDAAADAANDAAWRGAPADSVAADRPAAVLDLDRATWGRTRVLAPGGGTGRWLGVVTAPLREPARGGPRLVGAPVWYQPEHPFPWERLLEPLAVVLPEVAAPPDLDLADRRVGVYRFDDGRWRHVGRLQRVDEGWWHELDHPGAHAVGWDPDAPVLVPPATTRLEPAPAAGRPGVSPPRWKPLAVGVHDAGSGVDWDTVRVTVAGAALIAEPDAPRDRLLLEFPDALADGPHRVAVRVADVAGNAAAAAFTVQVGDPR